MALNNKRCFIFGEFDSENIGDQAIFNAMKYSLQAYNFDVFGIGLQSGKVSNQTRHDFSTDTHTHIAPMPRTELCKHIFFIFRRIWLFIWVIKKIYTVINIKMKYRLSPNDIFLFGGGGILMNNNYHFPFALFLWSFLLKAISANYTIVGVGNSGKHTLFSKYLLRSFLSGACRIYSRDFESKKFIESLSGKSSIIGPDMVFSTTPCILNSNRTSYFTIGINIICQTHNFSDKEYTEYLCNLSMLLSTVSRHSSILLFSTGCQEDNIIIKMLYKSIKPNNNVTVLLPLTEDELVSGISKCKMVICSRLHAALLAIRQGVPALLLDKDIKAKSFYRSLDMSRHLVETPDFLLDIDELIHKSPTIEFQQNIAIKQHNHCLCILNDASST